jgi:hypothetical protein
MTDETITLEFIAEQQRQLLDEMGRRIRDDIRVMSAIVPSRPTHMRAGGSALMFPAKSVRTTSADALTTYSVKLRTIAKSPMSS